jgi:hypothetical protein
MDDDWHWRLETAVTRWPSGYFVRIKDHPPDYGALAQLVEQWIVYPKVRGSNPLRIARIRVVATKGTNRT